MRRQDFVLATIAACEGAIYSPVQVQKMFFLLERNLAPRTFAPRFSFKSYHYGPYSKEVYDDLEALAAEALAAIHAEGSWRRFALTTAGIAQGRRALAVLPLPVQKYIKQVSDFVLRLSFSELVSAIYKAYPDMRKNSVFRE
jgi:uncharacterized protein YwgA